MALAQSEALALGRRIAAMREARGWTQRDLGSKAGGYSHSAVARLEGGERPDPSAGLIYGIARAFNMTFEALWTGQGPQPRRPSPRAHIEGLVRQLGTVIRALPPSPRPLDGSTRPLGGKGKPGARPSGRSRPSSP